MKSKVCIVGGLLLLSACQANPASQAEGPDDDEGNELSYPSNRKTIDYSGSVSGLYWGGGAVMTGSTNLHLIFYGTHWTSNQINILIDFAKALGGSPLANVLTSYTADGADGNRGSSSFNFVDYAVRSNYGRGSTLSDSDYDGIVNDAIAAGLANDPTGIYLVYTDQGAGTVNSMSGACDCGHHWTSGNGHQIAQMDSGAWCRSLPVDQPLCTFPYPTSPNGDPDIDVMASTSWHEIAETVSDPINNPSGYRTRWVAGSSTSGQTEVADLCGRALSEDDGSNPPVAYLQLDRDYAAANLGVANVHLGARDFLMQPIWQNADRGGCVRRLGFSRPAWNSSYPAGDVDGNGIADLLWRDSATGAVWIWTLDAQNTATLPFTPTRTLPEDWQIYGFGRFNVGNKSDIIIRNLHTGEVRVWLMNGMTVGQVVSLVTPPSGWLLKAVGDFNGDGYTDLLFQNMNNNATRVWLNNAPYNGGTPVTIDFNFIGNLLGGLSTSDNSEVVGTGDFSGDGHHAAEVLWYDLDSGHYRSWSINGSLVTQTDLGVEYFNCDRVLGIADMDGDNTADLVCEMQSGTKLGWVRMSGGSPASWTTIADLPGHEWRFSGASTFGASRQTGLLWRNRKTGDLARWLIGAGGTTWSSTHLENGLAQSMEIISY
jgi:hypothetical protein